MVYNINENSLIERKKKKSSQYILSCLKPTRFSFA